MSSTTATRTRESQEERPGAATRVAKVVEIIGISNEGWEAAAQVAVEEARKTIENIHGIKIKNMTAKLIQLAERL
jgi:flavin-binding protein dodecin